MVQASSFFDRRMARAGFRAAILLALFVNLTGCAHRITTLQASVTPMPSAAPAISLPPLSVSDLGSKPAFTFAHFDAELRNTILREGGGQVVWDSTEPDLVLAEVSLRATPAKQGNILFGVTMGMLSLAPPFAFIPEFRTSSYVLDYAIDDRFGRQVLAGRIQDQVKGRYMGMYIGRIKAEQQLIESEGKFLSEHAGRRLLSEIRAKSDVLAQALAHSRSNPKTTAKEKARGDKIREARGRRRIALFAESTHLISAKKFQGPAPPVFGVAGAMVPLFEPGAPAPAAMLAYAGGPSRSVAVQPAVLARPAGYRPRSARGVGRIVVLPPRISMGPKNPMQDRILANSMRSKLGETRELVSAEETTALLTAAMEATGDAVCSSDACLSDLRERAGVAQTFSLEILRDASGTQLVIHVSGPQGNDSRSKFCGECDTAKLDESLGVIATAMVEATLPHTATAMMAPATPSGPAMLRPAVPSTSVGGQLANGAMDAIKQCAAKMAAQQACSLVPSFGGTACKIAVSIKFKGSLCP